MKFVQSAFFSLSSSQPDLLNNRPRVPSRGLLSRPARPDSKIPGATVELRREGGVAHLPPRPCSQPPPTPKGSTTSPISPQGSIA